MPRAWLFWTCYHFLCFGFDPHSCSKTQREFQSRFHSGLLKERKNSCGICFGGLDSGSIWRSVPRNWLLLSKWTTLAVLLRMFCEAGKCWGYQFSWECVCVSFVSSLLLKSVSPLCWQPFSQANRVSHCWNSLRSITGRLDPLLIDSGF